MITELVDQIITIDAEIVPKGNVNVHHKLRKIPAGKTHTIKNAGMRKQKERLDKAYRQKDLIALTLKSHYNGQLQRGGVYTCKRDWQVWTSMIFYFGYKKSINPAMLKKDMDNCEKFVQDAITASGVVQDDSQITFKMTSKQVTADRPRLEILSIAASDSWLHFKDWMDIASANAVRRIYEHQIDTQKI